MCFIFWLVVSTLLKNISQVGLLFPIYEYGKIKNVPNHQPVYIYPYYYDHSAVQSPEMLGDSGMVCSTCHHHIETSNLLTDDDSWMFVLFCTIMGFHGIMGLTYGIHFMGTIIIKYGPKNHHRQRLDFLSCDLMVLALWQGPQIFRSRRHSTCESPFCGSQVGGCEWRS